jgi:hypothetical protein
MATDSKIMEREKPPRGELNSVVPWEQDAEKSRVYLPQGH